MLLFFANLKFILALDADDSMKQIFLPTFAKEAISRKCFGNANVIISIQNAKFRTATDIIRHFLMSASKFWPNLAAKRIAPIYPAPSFRTH